MSTSNLIRWGGVALLLGGLLWGMQKIGWPLFIGNQDPRAYPQPAATIQWVMGLVAALLILLGLPALYARQAAQAGRLGLVAFLTVFTGMALVTSMAYFGTFVQAGLVDLILLAEEAGVTVQEPAAVVAGFRRPSGAVRECQTIGGVPLQVRVGTSGHRTMLGVGSQDEI